MWEKSPYKGSGLLIHLKMADWANEGHGWMLWCGDDTLAQVVRCNRRTVIRTKEDMIKDGYLEDLHERHENGNLLYRFLMPGSTQCDILSATNVTFATDQCDISSIAPITNQRDEIVDDLNELLARRYALFAGSQPVNHKTKKWRTDMRLLLERGMSSWAKPVAIPPDAVRKRINGIFDHLATPGPSGFCWASNIRSPGSLREHWDQIGVEAKKRSSNGSRPQTIEDAQGNLIEVHG